MLKTLCIADIHQKIKPVQHILNELADSFDKIVFLGDYFDCYKVTEFHYGFDNTCKWLIETHDKLGDKAIWLAGNHDVSYLEEAQSPKPFANKSYGSPYYGGKIYHCAGYTRSKGHSAKKYFGRTKHPFLRNLRLFYEDNYFLYSHAGFKRQHFIPSLSYKENIEYFTKCWERFVGEISNPQQKFEHSKFIWGIGYRAGSYETAGPLWLDWNEEFESIDGINQIVGHTHVETPSFKDGSWNCDTGLRYCLSVNGPNVEIKKINHMKSEV